MKTRSSSGVGSKLDLSFNIDSLRIQDLDESERDDPNSDTTSIYQKLKTKTTIEAGETVTENNMAADPQVNPTDRLKSLLRKSE